MIYRTLLPLLALIATTALIIPVGQAQETQNQAGVVIRYGDGHVATACVRFSEPSISGIELLQRAGISVIAQSGGIGSAVCKISNDGCDYPSEDCFCQCKGGNCAYWAYQRLRGDHWAYSPIGASASQVQPGDVDGWAWGAGSVQSGAAPPVIPLDQICSENPVALPPTIPPPTSVPAPATAPKPTFVPVPTTIPPTLRPSRTAAISAPPSQPTTTAAISAPPSQPTTTAVISTLPSQLPTAALSTQTPTLMSTELVQSNPPTALPPTSTVIAATPTAIPPSSTSIASTINTPQPQPAKPATGDSTSYLIFGILVLLLGAGIVLTFRRRKNRNKPS
jgi:LPXTG-motif cell wall-anchored protein